MARIIWDKDPRIVIVGPVVQVTQFYGFLNSIKDKIVGHPEPEIRLYLMSVPMKEVTIMVDGNRVWSKKKILDNISHIVATRDARKMSNYLYEFLTLVCGSIAHYNKAGWLAEYPTVGDLMGFFKRNEFGSRVVDHVPRYMADAKVIVLDIERVFMRDEGSGK